MVGTAPGIALVTAFAVLAPAVGVAVASTEAIRGTYRLQGRAQVDARPFPAQDEEIHADAVLSPGARGGQVRIHLAAQGFGCELAATLDAAGALALAPGQRCAVDLNGDEVVGHVEARLVSGSGRVTGDALWLELAFSLAGTVSLRPGGTLEALGRVLVGSDPVPVRGQASGRAEGRRDRSRAAK